MATATVGTLQEFKPELKSITAYLERFTAFIDTNDIKADKHVATLLSVIGPKTYSILRSLIAPESPQSKSLDALYKILKTHYDLKPLVILERYNFHCRNQSPTKSIAEYIAELRRLVSTCDFGNFLGEALCDCLICGM